MIKMRDWKRLMILVVLVIIGSCVMVPSVMSVSESEVTSSSATIYVPDDYATIRKAVNFASAGDTIVVKDGVYMENVLIDKALTIKSEHGADHTSILASFFSKDPIFYVLNADYVNISGFTIIGATESAGIGLKDSDNCNISNINATNNHYGILLLLSNNNTLTNNTVNSNRLTGFLFEDSSNNTITDNNIDSNNYGGIFMSSSNNNTITRNTANYSYLGRSSSGIYLHSSNYNTLTENTFSTNNIGINLNSSSNNTLKNNNVNSIISGILLDSSNHNAITKNTVNSNKQTGIGLHSSNNNTITKNTASMNNGGGILLAYSSHNLIYLNNFINNVDNFLLFGSLYFDTWNSTEEIAYSYNETTYTNHLGNYWSDYKGTDENEDGIGDTPYSIESDKDNHPLMEPLENYLGDQADLVPTSMPEQKTWHLVRIFASSESGENPSFNITGDKWRVKRLILESSSFGKPLFMVGVHRIGPLGGTVASWEWGSGSTYGGIQYIYEGKGSYSLGVTCMFVDNWVLAVEDYY